MSALPSTIPPSSGRSVYSEAERTQALAVYAETRSVRSAHLATGIPQRTISEWTLSEEGIAVVASIRLAIRERLGFKLVQGIVMAQDRLLERIEEGDPYVHDGRVTYAPVKAKDLGLLIGIQLDKLLILNAGAETQSNPDKQLTKLVDSLMVEIRKAIPKADSLPASANPSSYLG